MIGRAQALVFLLPVLAAASSPAIQFNLDCNGMRSTQTFLGEKSEPYSTTYRINLKQEKWCEGECTALQDFAAILPTQFQLENSKTDLPSDRSLTTNFIDRETGRHAVSATSSSPRDSRSTIIMKWVGQCERTAFTGFPQFNTKF